MEKMKKGTGLVIEFNPPVLIRKVGGINITTNKITIVEITDSSVYKTVTAITDGNGFYVLWKDAAYDAIGQWTDTDVINRMRELLVANNNH